MKKYQCPPQRQDSSYGDNPLNVNISMAELKRLCSEYIDRLTVNDTEAKEIAKQQRDSQWMLVENGKDRDIEG